MIDHPGECDTPTNAHPRPIKPVVRPCELWRAHLSCRAEQQGPSFPSARSHRTLQSGKTLLFYSENEIIAPAIYAHRDRNGNCTLFAAGNRSFFKILVFQEWKAFPENLKKNKNIWISCFYRTFIITFIIFLGTFWKELKIFRLNQNFLSGFIKYLESRSFDYVIVKVR